MMLTHANSINDLQRLRLLAQTSGDLAAAAAKRLPRDGRLLSAARGELTFNRDLWFAAGGVLLALVGLALVVMFNVVKAIREALRAQDEDDHNYESELLEISTSNWRPL